MSADTYVEGNVANCLSEFPEWWDLPNRQRGADWYMYRNMPLTKDELTTLERNICSYIAEMHEEITCYKVDIFPHSLSDVGNPKSMATLEWCAKLVDPGHLWSVSCIGSYVFLEQFKAAGKADGEADGDTAGDIASGEYRVHDVDEEVGIGE